MKLAPYDRKETEVTKLIEQVKESERRSFGVVVNSFYELEPDYADYYRKVLGRAWHIGPILLCNRKNEEKFQKSDDKQECLQWLDTKKQSSVIYVCFWEHASTWTDTQIEELHWVLKPRARIHMVSISRGANGDLPMFAEQFFNEQLITEVLRNWSRRWGRAME
ncbi:hypothetical protein HAX54_033752 [Datura stramonium]|uniref:Uncharacterized protein n=1 Tax=Datura stramonium TaxID=4076 RepID=A0ABS8VDY6_DATST|nr:hypothetical protein [Datura stramonium]